MMQESEIIGVLVGEFGLSAANAALSVELIRETVMSISAKAQVKEELKKAFDAGDVEAMEVFKGFAVDTGEVGWHYRWFGRSEHHFMGKSVAAVKEYVAEKVDLRADERRQNPGF